MTDEQRHDWLGYSSDGHFETPNIDRLAKTGVRFDRAHTSETTCVPARTALLTGLYDHRTPRQKGSLALREGSWTVARELQAAGYETALIGRMHLSPIHADHGFETMRMCEIVIPEVGTTTRTKMITAFGSRPLAVPIGGKWSRTANGKFVQRLPEFPGCFPTLAGITRLHGSSRRRSGS